MVNWQTIDTVLLDMDGTLLDLHYDNYFWLTHLPRRYAEIHAISADEAQQKLTQAIENKRGTLDWYCLDYWSELLQVDIVELKQEVKHKIKMRPYAQAFLDFLTEENKHAVLVTNAHPDSLSLKLSVIDFEKDLAQMISSHALKYPKEQLAFWQALEKHIDFDPQKTLFIDDTQCVLNAARNFGIGHVLGIHQPDSQIERKLDDVPAIHHFNEIM